MRIAALATTIATACVIPPPSMPSNTTTEHRASVELGADRLTAAVPAGVPVYTNRALLMWSFEEVETATIELRPPHVPAFLSVSIFPVPAAFEVDRVARATERRIVARRSTPLGTQLAVVEDHESPVSSELTLIPSIVVHRKDLGVVCEATAYPDPADQSGSATLDVGAHICESLQR
jgi:hypothetical protein